VATDHVTDLRPVKGRIVMYVAGTQDDNDDRPAIVTEVHADTPDTVDPVDLTVFTPTGDLRPQQVAYDGSAVPSAGTWHWPRPTTLDA
jgi:hypothetical protein